MIPKVARSGSWRRSGPEGALFSGGRGPGLRRRFGGGLPGRGFRGLWRQGLQQVLERPEDRAVLVLGDLELPAAEPRVERVRLGLGVLGGGASGERDE